MVWGWRRPSERGKARQMHAIVHALSITGSMTWEITRALIRKGADFSAAMAFEIASTNLVIELGVILALLMGWQFTLAEFTGGPLMIVLLAVLFRLLLRDRLLR